MPTGYPSEGQAWMTIDPDECIDCGACLPECPVDAILDNTSDDPYWATINKNLAPAHNGQRGPMRPRDEAPRRPDNSLR